MIDASVRVVAITNPLSQRSQEWRERDGVSIARVLRRIDPKYQRCRKAVLINGRPIPPEEFGTARAHSGDLVNIKVVPRFGGSPLGTLGTLGLGVGSLAAMWLLSRKGGSNTSTTSASQTNTLAPPPETPPDPPVAPLDNYGGPADTVMPAIMGIENRFNNWGPIPVVYGVDIPVSPVKIASEYFLTIGGEQWMYAALSAGIGPLDITDIKIGETPIADLVAAGVCSYEIREGKPGDIDTPLTIYTKDVNQVTHALDLDYGVVQVATGGQEATELAVDIVFPDGLYNTDVDPTYDISQPGSTTTGVHYTPPNPYGAQTCSFTIEYRLHGSGGAWSSRTLNVTDNTRNAKIVGDTWTVAQGVYDVRVTRTTADTVVNTDTYEYSGQVTVTRHHHYYPTQTAQWTALKSIKASAPINTVTDVNGNHYPITKIALKIKASEITNGTLKNLTCKVSRYLKTYNGSAWTSPVVTDNPAWAYVDAITGFINDGRLGVEYVNASNMKDWADFCDLKGFSYNKPIEEFTTLEELLDEIASHGLASRNQPDGIYEVIIDKARSAIVQMFTQHTTNNLEVEVDYPDYAHGVKIKFRNRDADWETDERTVYADGYNENNATNFETIEMAGLSDADAAWKLGRYFAMAPLLRPIKYRLEVDPQHVVCKRGDLVGLNYDVSFDGLGGGIIRSVTDDGSNNILTITLSQSVTMETGGVYGIQIRLPDHTFSASCQVNTVAGTTRTLTLTTPLAVSSPSALVDKYVSFGELGQELTKCLVESIEHVDDLGAVVTLVDYSPDLFNVDSGSVPAYTPNIQVRHAAKLPVLDPPVVLGTPISDERALLETPGALIPRIQISLAPPTSSGIGYVETQYRESGSGATGYVANYRGPVAETVYISNVTEGRTYDVQIRYQSNVYPGLSSDWTTILNHTIVGQSTPPPDVLVLYLQGDEVTIKYDGFSGVAVPKDWLGFEIRWAQGTSADWDNMIVLGSVTNAKTFNISALPLGNLVIAVKAVDRTGNRSTNAAYLYRNLDATLIANQYIEVTESPTWTGTKTNFTQNGNELWADASASLFWNAAGSPFWGSNPSSAFYGVGYLTAIYEWEYTPPSDLAKPYRIYVKTTSDGTPSGTSLIDADIYFVEYKRNSQARFWDADTASTFWSRSPFYESDSNTDVWLPMPQQGLDGAREKYTFRITCLASSARRPKLKEGIGVLVDVPDVTESGSLVCAATTGTALSLTQTYREIRGVQVTLQYDATNYPAAVGGHAQVDLSVSPPVVRVYNAAGTTVVAGKVTYTTIGV